MISDYDCFVFCFSFDKGRIQQKESDCYFDFTSYISLIIMISMSLPMYSSNYFCNNLPNNNYTWLGPDKTNRTLCRYLGQLTCLLV